ncbi:MAG TPA: hypothetical protein VNG69_11395 [Casimicrobiaceae bacterium]|nr:hypothetical protein [Casimicrobiaceae bacterium]
MKAGWLIKDKGLWSLSDEGRAAYQRYPDPEKLAQEARRLYKQWKSQQPADEEATSEEEPAVEAATTLEEAEESSWG